MKNKIFVTGDEGGLRPYFSPPPPKIKHPPLGRPTPHLNIRYSADIVLVFNDFFWTCTKQPYNYSQVLHRHKLSIYPVSSWYEKANLTQLKSKYWWWPLGWGQYWLQGHNLNKHCRGPLDDAVYQISKLWAVWFQKNLFLQGFPI